MLLEEVAPSRVAEERSALGRFHDVQHENGRQEAFAARGWGRAGHKFLDRRVHRFGIEAWPADLMACSREDEQPRAWDQPGHIPHGLDRGDGIPLAHQDQGRHLERRQHVADVDLAVHLLQRNDRGRRGRRLDVCEPLVSQLFGSIRTETGAPRPYILLGWPAVPQRFDHLGVLLLFVTPRVPRLPDHRRRAAPHDQTTAPFRVLCGEHT